MSEKTLPAIPSSGLPRWPESVQFVCKSTITPCHTCGHAYEHARADAAMARLRLAVEALRQLDGMVHSISQEAVTEALSAIGPLPGE